jgi:hypothetical protein
VGVKWTWILGLAANQVRIWRRFVGTAKVLAAIRPNAVLTLGDNQYPSGSLADFEASYADTWGAYCDITFPAPGNARGYFAYFG